MQIPGYKILEPLGKGGMAQVYLALQESVGRKVAIKVMNAALTPDPQFIERFIAEARCANLSHPNIITVFDAGQADNQPFIVMEFIEGGDLAKRLRQGPMTPAQALAVIRQVAGALHTSHQKGYVHRDVKPENVLFRDDKTVVLADFGIAKALQSHGSMTQTGMIIGSPSYMSPEQVKGEELDGRADLYSLGVMFYQLLTGNKPYQAEDTYALGYKHINEPIPSLPLALKTFQPLLISLMAKQKAERVASGQDLIKRIDALARSLTAQQVSYPIAAEAEYPFSLALAAGAVSFTPVPQDEDADKTQIKPALSVGPDTQTREEPARPASRAWLAQTLMAAVVLVAAAGGAFWWYTQQPAPDTTASSAPQPTSEAVTPTPADAPAPSPASEPKASAQVAPPAALPPEPPDTAEPAAQPEPVQAAAAVPKPVAPAVPEAVEKPVAKPKPDPQQLALAQALKKAKTCLDGKDFLCAEAESGKALALDANNASAKSMLEKARAGQTSAKKKFVIE